MSTLEAKHTIDTELGKLRRDLRESGWYSTNNIQSAVQLSIFMTIVSVGFLVYVLPSGSQLAGACLSSVGLLGVATFGHSASHNSVFGSRTANSLAALVCYPLVLGFSREYWQEKHIRRHHAAPNCLEFDDDIDFRPWFTVAVRESDSDMRRSNSKRVGQIALLLLGIALVGFGSRVDGIRYIIKEVSGRQSRRRRLRLIIDVVLMLLHYSTLVMLPVLKIVPGELFGWYTLSTIGIGPLMFIAFAPSHLCEGPMCYDRVEIMKSPAMRQIVTTANYRTGPLARYWLCGLDHQIEHHLFPGVPHHQYPELGKSIQNLCARSDVPYHEKHWGTAVVEALACFLSPKTVVTSSKDAQAAIARKCRSAHSCGVQSTAKVEADDV
jgi:linoleoyl-CoA desaturase